MENKTIIFGKTLFSLHGVGGLPLVTIYDNGTTVFSNGYNPDAAAKIFWDAIAKQIPDNLTNGVLDNSNTNLPS